MSISNKKSNLQKYENILCSLIDFLNVPPKFTFENKKIDPCIICDVEKSKVHEILFMVDLLMRNVPKHLQWNAMYGLLWASKLNYQQVPPPFNM